jgi:hypothetical protein
MRLHSGILALASVMRGSGACALPSSFLCAAASEGRGLTTVGVSGATGKPPERTVRPPKGTAYFFSDAAVSRKAISQYVRTIPIAADASRCGLSASLQAIAATVA